MLEMTLSVSVMLMHRESRVQRLEQDAARKGAEPDFTPRWADM